MLHDRYVAVSPGGPDHWTVILGKAWQMITSGEPNIDPATLGAVRAPTLVRRAGGHWHWLLKDLSPHFLIDLSFSSAGA